MVEYENYHCHSAYSNALTSPDSTVFISDYAKTYKERDQHVLCISEHGNRSNVWEQFDICESFKKDEYQITPLAAAECYFVPDRKALIDGKLDSRNFHLILVAKNMEGFYELNEILSEANLTGYYYRARVDFDLLGRLNYKNFLCTTACFVEGTKVKTQAGWKNIEDITSEDFVLNMYGQWEKVNFPTQRKYNGNGIKVFTKDNDTPIICTENHKFLVTSVNKLKSSKLYNTSALKWVEAKDLDYFKSDSSKYVLLSPVYEHDYLNSDIIIKKSEWKNKLVKRSYKVKHPIKEEIKLTPEIMRLFGLWLGDGHISINENTHYYNVGISFAEDEFENYWNDFVKIASEQIGITWSKRTNSHHKTEISSHCIEFVEFMHYIFGNKKADTKEIPQKILHISKEFDMNIAFGMLLADGYFRTQTKDGYNFGSCVYRSINKKLTSQLKTIFDDNNIRTGHIATNKERIDKNGIKHKESYTLNITNNAFINKSKKEHFTNNDIVNIFKHAQEVCKQNTCEINGVLYVKKYIRKIERIKLNEVVHCLNVNSHSFVCENVVVHNCVAGVVRDEHGDKLCCQLAEIFRENFYLEVQHHPQQIQIETNMKVLRLYQKYHWPLIYGTDSHYINKEDKILRTELMLSKGISYGDEDSFDLFLPTAEEAYKLLETQGVLTRARIEEAMENTLVLREFEGVKFTKEKKIPNAYPEMTLEERNKLYKDLCINEYIAKAGTPTEEEKKEILDEMSAVADTNTADYFLIAKRVVDRAKELGGVLTKTGRGSGSSFCTNFSLGFTSLNRLHSPVKLYPERFISRERMASGILPDLDLNLTNVEAFEKAGKEILGEYGCLPMLAYGTTKTLSAFKMLAKARGLDFETSNAISKEINSYELDVKHAIENNQDDPDYNVDEDVDIESYVDEKYIDLINDSKQYKGIIVSWSVHPCAHLLLDRDIRREIGLVKVKDFYCAYIDGTTADSYGYLKLDFLTVTVVKIISETFKVLGLPMMTVDELLDKCKNDKSVWDLYAKGMTQGLNQCEQPKSTERVMKYRPRNIAELCLFVAAIRPGFRSMLDTFITRTPFAYNIESLDNLLKTKEIPDSFLAYDEQVLSILISAGINAADAYVCLKGIKKKKYDKVESYKEKFKTGFMRHLQEDEHATPEEAAKTVDNIWKIIESSASYLFNASHSLCVACDSLYVAYLKAHYPYELYTTMLKLYDEKKNTEKISNIISEMKRYKNIKLLAGQWGQDNTDWSADKENATISQSISSIKYMSKQAAEDLYNLSQQEQAYIGSVFKPDVFTPEAKKELAKLKRKLKPLQEKAEIYLANGGDAFDEQFLVMYDEGLPLEQKIKQIEQNDNSYESKAKEEKHYAELNCFTNILRAIQMNTCLDTRQIEILIGLNYFKQFGKSGKLMKVFNEFFNGEKKITKQIKSFEERLDACRKYESSLEDSELPAGLRLQYEMNNIGLCLSTDASVPTNVYFVTSLDDKYTIKLNLYNIQRGTTGLVKIAKKDYHTLGEGSCIQIDKYRKGLKYTYSKGQKVLVPGEYEIWVTNYKVLQKGEIA